MKALIGFGLAIALLGSSLSASAQTNIPSTPRSNGTGGYINYPSGSQIYRSGEIVLPDSTKVFPTNTVRNGDGTTTFYYSNGTKITTQGNTVSPSGSYLSPGSNGQLRTNTLSSPGGSLDLLRVR